MFGWKNGWKNYYFKELFGKYLRSVKSFKTPIYEALRDNFEDLYLLDLDSHRVVCQEFTSSPAFHPFHPYPA